MEVSLKRTDMCRWCVSSVTHFSFRGNLHHDSAFTTRIFTDGNRQLGWMRLDWRDFKVNFGILVGLRIYFWDIWWFTCFGKNFTFWDSGTYDDILAPLWLKFYQLDSFANIQIAKCVLPWNSPQSLDVDLISSFIKRKCFLWKSAHPPVHNNQWWWSTIPTAVNVFQAQDYISKCWKMIKQHVLLCFCQV